MKIDCWISGWCKGHDCISVLVDFYSHPQIPECGLYPQNQFLSFCYCMWICNILPRTCWLGLKSKTVTFCMLCESVWFSYNYKSLCQGWKWLSRTGQILKKWYKSPLEWLTYIVKKHSGTTKMVSVCICASFQPCLTLCLDAISFFLILKHGIY